MKIYTIKERIKKNRISFITEEEPGHRRVLKKAAGAEDILEISGRARQRLNEENIIHMKKVREEKEKEREREEIKELIIEQDKKAEAERRSMIARLKISIHNINAIQDDPEVLKETSAMISSLLIN
jgi:hypothetical protein